MSLRLGWSPAFVGRKLMGWLSRRYFWFWMLMMGQAWQSRVCLLTLKPGSVLLCSLRVAGWWVDLLQPVTCVRLEVKTDVSQRRQIPPLPLKSGLHADISGAHLNPLGTSSSTIQAGFVSFSFSLHNLFIQLVLSASVWVRDHHTPAQGQPAVATPTED